MLAAAQQPHTGGEHASEAVLLIVEFGHITQGK